jgi:hypothetical protein
MLQDEVMVPVILNPSGEDAEPVARLSKVVDLRGASRAVGGVEMRNNHRRRRTCCQQPPTAGPATTACVLPSDDVEQLDQISRADENDACNGS